jgi:hypothetical protein
MKTIEWITTQPSGKRIRSRQHHVDALGGRPYCRANLPKKANSGSGRAPNAAPGDRPRIVEVDLARLCAHCERIAGQKARTALDGKYRGRSMGRPVRRW